MALISYFWIKELSKIQRDKLWKIEIIIPEIKMPEWWDICIPDVSELQHWRDSIVISEKRLVEGWFKHDSNKITIPTDSWNLYINRLELDSDINSYKWEPIVSSERKNNTLSLQLLWKWWQGYIDYISSSDTILKKIVKQFKLNEWSEEEKVKKIIFFLQQKNHHMKYKFDSNPREIREPQDWKPTWCWEYVRKPWISILNWLMPNGHIWDCDDYASNFIALCKASGIKEESLFWYNMT